MAVFVIGDIHGCHGALLQCLDRAGFDNEVDTLISLGDIIDGGSDSYECVEELLKIKNLIAVKGNHDDWFLEFIETGVHPGGWKYGSCATIQSYSKHAQLFPEIRCVNDNYTTSFSPVVFRNTMGISFVGKNCIM